MARQYPDTNASRCTARALDAALLGSVENVNFSIRAEGQLPRQPEPPM